MASPLFLLPFSFLLLLSATATYISPAISQACKASRFPAACSDRLSLSLPDLTPAASPSDIIISVFRSSLRDLPTAISKTEAILAPAPPDVNRTAAARNCLEVLSYSYRRLSAAAAASDISSSADARAWAAAGQQYLSGCAAGLHIVGGTREVDDAAAFIAELGNRTADGLSMLAALEQYGSDTESWAPPRTERDGYWGRPPTEIGGVGGAAEGVKADLTVCEGCDYRTVWEAVEAAPANVAGSFFVIWIKKGVYNEIVRVPYEKTNLVFAGDGMGKTVITGNLSVGMLGISTYSSATVAVAGDGFMARDLTIRNTAGPAAHQAVAFRSIADHTILERVEISGYQDTLYPHSLRQFYKSCVISGTVDFIFGNAAAVFEDCLLLVLPRPFDPERGETDTVTAQGRTDPAHPTGFVFRRCVVNGTEEYWQQYWARPWAHRVYLGRPWKEYSRTVYLETYVEEIVRPEGWVQWAGDFALQTLYFGEYWSKGPGANPAPRVPWSSQIPAEHVGTYSVENFIQGNRWITVGRRAPMVSFASFTDRGLLSPVFVISAIIFSNCCFNRRRWSLVPITTTLLQAAFVPDRCNY